MQVSDDYVSLNQCFPNVDFTCPAFVQKVLSLSEHSLYTTHLLTFRYALQGNTRERHRNVLWHFVPSVNALIVMRPLLFNVGLLVSMFRKSL